MQQTRFYIPGVVLILFGVLVIAVPQILVALVAAGLVMAGIGMLSLGHRMRQAERSLGSMRFDDWFVWRCNRPSRFTRWHHYGR